MSNTPLLAFSLSLNINHTPYITQATASLNAGERIMLIGQSGSGKSLLLSALARLMPFNGQLSFNGVSHTAIAPSQWRASILLLAQTPYFNHGTVLENIKFPLSFKSHQHIIFDQNWHINHLQRFNKSKDFLNKEIHTLSGGEKQIVAFLRGLQLSPTILLLDEPTSALDDTNTKIFIETFLTYQKNNPNSACIWISHNLEHKQLLGANHIWMMENGILTISKTDKEKYGNDINFI